MVVAETACYSPQCNRTQPEQNTQPLVTQHVTFAAESMKKSKRQVYTDDKSEAHV